MQKLLINFENFTVDIYNKTIEDLHNTSPGEFFTLLASSPIGAIIFPQWQFTHIFDIIKLGWYMSLPKVGEYGASRLTMYKERPKINVDDLRDFKYDGTVINQIVTSGKNVKTVERTVRSIEHWYSEIERKYSIKVPHETWIVTDEGKDGGLRGLRGRLVVVPSDYETKNGSMYKARALQYATELRKEENVGTWVYYHDEETVFGEDSVLGVADLVNRDYDVGVHTIVYPINWKKRDILSVVETFRTSNDLTNMSLSPRGMWHGSGFMARAEVERDVGWDFGPVRAEDLLFHLRASRKYKYYRMKGFVYEIPPQNFKDFLKQRRRWILGIVDGFKDNRMDLRNKLKYFIDLVSWYSAGIGLLVPFFLYIHDASAPLPIGPYLTGPIWVTLMAMIKDGFVSTRRYAGLSWTSFPEFIVEGLAGLALEAIAPWYALFTGWRTKGFHVIDKG